MKPIIKREEQDTIPTSEITDNHLVVAVIDKSRPVILTKNYENDKGYYFLEIRQFFTQGNSVHFCINKASIESIVNKALELKGVNVEVFKESQWKKALQWLIDNCE